MSNLLLQELISGNPDDVKNLILEEFPDLFNLTNNPGLTEKTRKSLCIDRVKNDLTAAKSAPLSNPPSNFEDLPELKEVGNIRLTFSLSIALQTNRYLVLLRHAPAPSTLPMTSLKPYKNRLPILPAEFLDPISALGKEYFIIECDPSTFFRNYALYKSLMVAANCSYFATGSLVPLFLKRRGYNHRQAGALDLFLLPQLGRSAKKKLKKLGQSLYKEDMIAILRNPSISVENLCNPKSSSNSGKLLQQIDNVIDSLYDSSGLPKGFDKRQWALLKLYAYKTNFLNGLKLLP